MVPTWTSVVARANGIRRRLGDEQGFGVLEVLVSALIVVLVSLGVFSAIDAAGRTSDANKSRSIASDLAQTDQDRLRSMTITDVSKTIPDSTKVVDGETYTIKSKGEFQLGPADSTDCTSTEQAPRYLKLTSNVDWKDRRGVSPVEVQSLRVIPNGSTADLGTLSVEVDGADGAGEAGIPFTITSGGTSKTATTNQNGCAVWAFLKPGTWTISGSKAGFVTPDNPTVSTLTGSAVVAADGIATKSFSYDQAGGVTVNYKTNTYGSTTASTATTGDSFSIAQSGLGTPSYKVFTHTAAATGSTGLVNFPFTSNYQVYSGKCPENAGPTSQAGLVPQGNVVTVDVFEPRLRVRVQRRTNATTTATNNYAVMTNDSKTTLKFTPVNAACATAAATTGPFTTTTAVTRPIADTVVSGGTSGNYSTYEAVLPYGSYSVCAAYNASTSNRASATLSSVPNQTAAGSTATSTITVPFNSTTTYTCP